MMTSQRLLTIVGPTAVGKSDLAVKIARQYNGEIVSADSRQVYRGLDVGTGKITTEEMRGIPHHCLDIANPEQQITVAQYKQCANDAIAAIYERGRVPIVVGGTGFYVQTVVDDIDFPEVAPDHELRETLDQKTTEHLFHELQQKDPERAATIDANNKRRLIRALEIIEHRGKVPKISSGESPYNVLMLGLYMERDQLRERIRKRTLTRLDNGLIEEVQNLQDDGVSLQRLKEIGLTYYQCTRYLEGAVAPLDLVEMITRAEYKYARKQLSWFRRDGRIKWYTPDHDKKISDRVADFLSR